METFKVGINKADPKTASELHNAVIEFLAKYRAIPHTVTNTSFSEMLNNRRLRTTLDLLHPCQPDSTTLRVRQRANHVTHTKARQFRVGDSVWVRTFRPGLRWVPGTIKSKIGSVMYNVDIEGKEVTRRHHVNQLITRLTSLPLKMDSTSLSEHSQDSQPPTENLRQPLRQSTRIRKPRQVWVPT